MLEILIMILTIINIAMTMYVLFINNNLNKSVKNTGLYMVIYGILILLLILTS